MLEVYTSRFRVQRKIWHVREWVSPWPIPVWPGVGAAVVVFLQLQLGLLKFYTDVLPFPLNLGVLFGIAAVVYKLLDKPMIEGRPLEVWVRSQLRYWLIEPRVMTGELERPHEPTSWRVRLACWSPRGR